MHRPRTTVDPRAGLGLTAPLSLLTLTALLCASTSPALALKPKVEWASSSSASSPPNFIVHMGVNSGGKASVQCTDPDVELPITVDCEIWDVTAGGIGGGGTLLKSSEIYSGSFLLFSDNKSCSLFVPEEDRVDAHRYALSVKCTDDSGEVARLTQEAWWDGIAPVASFGVTPSSPSAPEPAIQLKCHDASFGYSWSGLGGYLPECDMECTLTDQDSGAIVHKDFCDDSPVTWDGGSLIHKPGPLSTGSYCLSVVPRDGGNRTGEPAEFCWDVYSVADKPETFVDEGPPTVTTAKVASFEFSCSLPPCTYRCTLNEVGQEVVWEDVCASGQPISIPGDGKWQLRAWAKDKEGDEDPGLGGLWTWSVDTTAPALAIDASCGAEVSNEVTRPVDVSCQDAVAESGGCSVACVLTHEDSGTETALADCEALSEVSLVDGDGSYALGATAVDGLGNTGESEELCVFLLDTTAPDTEILLGPPPVTADAVASFLFGCNEAGCVFDCELATGSGTIVDAGPCESGDEWTVPLDGDYVMTVLATDPAGNADDDPTGVTVSEWAWTVDSEVPAAPEILVPEQGETLTGCPFEVLGTAAVPGTVVVTLDGEDLAEVAVAGSGAWAYTLTEAQCPGDQCGGPSLIVSAAAVGENGLKGASDVVSVKLCLDTDGDGLMDAAETGAVNPTDPTKADSDGDGLCDGALSVPGVCDGGEDTNENGQVDPGETDPNLGDTDDDGKSDLEELNCGTNPTDKQSVCEDPVADPPPDAAVDAGPTQDADVADTNPEDTTAEDIGPDAEPDVVPDATPDVTPDTTPDVVPDAEPDTVPDATPDVVPDATPDVVPDTTPDATPDKAPDAAPDAVPDATPDAVPDTTPADVAADLTPDSTTADSGGCQGGPGSPLGAGLLLLLAALVRRRRA